MEFWLGMTIFVLCIVIFVLALKVHLMRKAAKEIEVAFTEKLEKDTNTLIGISCNDKYMRSLAEKLNVQLREFSAQRQQFRQRDIEVNNAITNITHDLRTPLTAICGYMELLEQEEVSEKAAQYIKIVENRAEILRKLTEELFDYSVDASSELELKKEAVDVNRVLQESIVAFYADFLECKITPKIQMTEKRIVRQADPDALSRVFANFLSNAIKYSDGDLDIILSENGEITFANTASALNNIEVGKLFDRFYTVENARKSTGLGLSISKILIEKMEGEITAEYEKNRLIIHVLLADANPNSEHKNEIESRL